MNAKKFLKDACPHPIPSSAESTSKNSSPPSESRRQRRSRHPLKSFLTFHREFPGRGRWIWTKIRFPRHRGVRNGANPRSDGGDGRKKRGGVEERGCGAAQFARTRLRDYSAVLIGEIFLGGRGDGGGELFQFSRSRSRRAWTR